MNTPSSVGPEISTEPTTLPQVPVMGQAQDLQKQNTMLKSLVYVFGAVILLGLGAAGMYLYQQNATPKPTAAVTETNNKPLPTAVPAATQKPSATIAGWKTYNGSGINLQYPSDWTYQAYDVPGRTNYHGLITLMPVNWKSEDGRVAPLSVSYWDNPKGLSVEQFDGEINQGAAMKYPLYDSLAQKVTVGGLPALYNPKGDCSPFPCHKYVISAGKKIWEVHGQYTTNPDEFKATTDQIISTFKFSDSNQTTTTADWKTYTSSKNGFTIKYPNKITAYKESWQYEEINIGGNNVMVSFGTPSSKSGGYIWSVNVYTDKTVEQLAKEQGQQFSDRKESRKTITVNGKSAILLTVTTAQVKDWISKTVFIEDGSKVFVIGNGAVELPEFEDFYNSFQLLN